jgi:GT2 family glycosyltransferase
MSDLNDTESRVNRSLRERVNFKSTVVVVPRETFSQSCDSLRNVLSSLDADQPIILVDGHSPDAVSKELRRIAGDRQVTFVQTNRYVSPNEARNLGAAHAETEYVVFVDNDLFVEPGWLEKLEQCADETGAAAVGPLYCIGRPIGEVIHMAGGPNRLEPGGNGRVHHVERHDHVGLRRDELPGDFQRHQTELLEFHCMLVRKHMLDALGPLDPELRGLHEHCDLCLLIEQAGGTVWIEPSAVVTYVPPGRLARTDYAFWFRRWSQSWGRDSIDHFWAKWGVDPEDPHYSDMLGYARTHRRRSVPYFRSPRKGPSTTARIDRVLYRTWALLFESLAALATVRMGRSELEARVLTGGPEQL